MTWVIMIKKKRVAFKKVKQWKALVENHTVEKVKWLETNNGLEFWSSNFDELYKNE